MKFTYTGGLGFVAKTSKGDICMSNDEKGLIATNHAQKEPKNGEFNLGLPCEMEIREILIKGAESRKGNTVYHFLADGTSFAHFGAFEGKPSKDFYDSLGESLDIALVIASENFKAKEIDQFLDTLSPRVAIIACKVEEVAAILTETGGEKAESNELNIKKSDMSADTEKVWVVTAE